MPLPQQLHDAERGRDPTRTLTLRRAFRAAGQLRLRKLRALLRIAVCDHNMLGLGSEPSFVASSARLQGFSQWFTAQSKLELAQVWPYEFLSRAVNSGEQAALAELRSWPNRLTFPAGRLDRLYVLSETELNGIAAALAQQVNRCAAEVVNRKLPQPAAFRRLALPFDKIGTRIDAFAEWLTVKAHNLARIEVYRANLITQVGIIAETHAQPRLRRFKDEEAGHPFRGNQYIGGESGGGQFTTATGGKSSSSPPPDQHSSGPARRILGKRYSPFATIHNGVIFTSNVQDATRALYENRKVVLNQPRQVSTLINHLARVSQRMIELGSKAPKFNLCNVSVPGTNLFCAEAKGIPRAQMPQVPSKQKEAFIAALQAKGFKVSAGTELASHLRATQDELDGAKVGKLANEMESGTERFPGDIFVSRDNYILDGHHRWAAKLGIDAKNNKLGDVSMGVQRVDIGIVQLLHEADEFTGGKGKIKFGDALESDDLVGWLTAGDDLVCLECEDLADDSPYTLDEAQDLIPVHPRCRCRVTPWFDTRFRGEFGLTTRAQREADDEEALDAATVDIGWTEEAREAAAEARRANAKHHEAYQSAMQHKGEDKHKEKRWLRVAEAHANAAAAYHNAALAFNAGRREEGRAMMRAAHENVGSVRDVFALGHDGGDGYIAGMSYDEEAGHPFRGNQYVSGQTDPKQFPVAAVREFRPGALVKVRGGEHHGVVGLVRNVIRGNEGVRHFVRFQEPHNGKVGAAYKPDELEEATAAREGGATAPAHYQGQQEIKFQGRYGGKSVHEQLRERLGAKPIAAKSEDELVAKARAFATHAHANAPIVENRVRKYTGEPYIQHPEEVVGIVASRPHTPEMLAAAWLHDVVEDTGVAHEVIEREFGPKVADLVFWLTHSSEPGNRAERKQRDRDRLARAPAEAQTIKVADLITNTRSIREHDSKFWKTYKQEVVALLNVMTKADRVLLRKVWSQLDPAMPYSPLEKQTLNVAWKEASSGKAKEAVDTYAKLLDEHARNIAFGLGFSAPRINVVAQDHAFELNGKKLYASMTTNVANAKVTIYAQHTSPEELAGHLAHEVMHVKYGAYAKAVEDQADNLRDEVAEGKDEDKLLGEPHYALLAENRRLFADTMALANEDGVSAYSTEWWNSWRGGKERTPLESPIHETLAEIARFKLEGRPVYQAMTKAEVMARLKALGSAEGMKQKLSGEPPRRFLDIYDAVERFWNERKPTGWANANA